MKKILLILSLGIFSSVFVNAQSSTGYNKGELFVGYSNGQVDNGTGSGNSIRNFFATRVNYNGFNASGVYNISRHLGIKADVSGTYNKDTFTSTFGGATLTATNQNALYNALGGVQVKDNSSSGRFKPFAHGLVGIGHARTNVTNVTCIPTTICTTNNFTSQTLTDTGFAGAFGGGLDVRLTDRLDIRVIQADYNPIWFSGGVTHNARFGFGIVIK